MSEEISHKFRGVWIPREVWLDGTLTWMEKCLWAEIFFLGTPEEPCTASNEYLAKIMGSSPSSIANMISDLTKAGLITRISYDGRRREMYAVIPAPLHQPVNPTSPLGEVRVNSPVNIGTREGTREEKTTSPLGSGEASAPEQHDLFGSEVPPQSKPPKPKKRSGGMTPQDWTSAKRLISQHLQGQMLKGFENGLRVFWARHKKLAGGAYAQLTELMQKVTASDYLMARNGHTNANGNRPVTPTWLFSKTGSDGLYAFEKAMDGRYENDVMNAVRDNKDPNKVATSYRTEDMIEVYSVETGGKMKLPKAKIGSDHADATEKGLPHYYCRRNGEIRMHDTYDIPEVFTT